MTDRYRVAHMSELEIKTGPDSRRWATVRSSLEIGAFGVNAWTAEHGGQQLIGEHDELGVRSGGHEELYFVSNGRATFTVAGDKIDAPAGTFVFVRDPAAKRSAVAKEPETTVLVAGGRRGEAFSPSKWEVGARALRHWDSGDFEAAVEELTQLHSDQPDDANVLYNLACAESRTGRRDEALGHLRRSVELDAAFAEIAASDPDFEAIRDDPEFSAVAGKADAGGSSP